jgi:hypothetical protein
VFVPQGGASSAIEPGSMLWLIQRDFLEGKSVEAMVKESLAPVANPHGDRDISQAGSSCPHKPIMSQQGLSTGLNANARWPTGEQDSGVSAPDSTKQ